MTPTFAGQLINLLAALLLLIAFAMLSQRRILSLINLFAWQGFVLAVSTTVVAYCYRPASPVLFRGADAGAEGVRCCPGCCTG